MKILPLLLGALAPIMAAFPATAQAPAARAEVESVAYSAVTGLHGAAASCGAPRCPAYSIVAKADGTVIFEGRDTAVAARRFSVPRATWRALVDRLAGHRPSGTVAVEPGSPKCKDLLLPEVGRPPVTAVTWTAAGRTDTLRFNGECDGRSQEAVIAALDGARQAFFDLLPMKALVDGR